MMRGEVWHKYVVSVPSLSLIRLLCSAQDEQYWIQLILSIIFPTGTHFWAKNFNVIWLGILFGVFCEYFHCGTTTMACIVVAYLFNGMWYTDLAKASQYHAFWKFIYKNFFGRYSVFSVYFRFNKEYLLFYRWYNFFGGKWATSLCWRKTLPDGIQFHQDGNLTRDFLKCVNVP